MLFSTMDLWVMISAESRVTCEVVCYISMNLYCIHSTFEYILVRNQCIQTMQYKPRNLQYYFDQLRKIVDRSIMALNIYIFKNKIYVLIGITQNNLTVQQCLPLQIQ